MLRPLCFVLIPSLGLGSGFQALHLQFDLDLIGRFMNESRRNLLFAVFEWMVHRQLY